jgi:hypothetical protein
LYWRRVYSSKFSNLHCAVSPGPLRYQQSHYTTYVRPRCDEIHFSKHSPISSNLYEGSGFRHSSSRSCIERNQSQLREDQDMATRHEIQSKSSLHQLNAMRDMHRARMLTQQERCRSTYLDSKILVNLHNLSKDVNVLHDICKFPAAPNALQQSRFLGGLSLRGIDRLGAAALSRSHRGGGTRP